MKLESLHYFHVVRGTGSIRKAAERLHIAPSAISRQIAILEKELGVKLFERVPTGVRSTEAGELLTRHTYSIFRDVGRAKSAIEELRGLRVGEVTVFAMEGLVSEFLPKLLSSFHKRFPGISFNLVLASTDQIVEAIIRDEADIGITFNAKIRQELSVVARYAEPVGCLVAPQHPLANEKAVTLKKVSEFPLALPNETFGLRQLIDGEATRRRIRLNAMFTTNSLELTKKAAISGSAVAFMPPFTVRSEVARGGLRCIPMKEKAFRSAYSEVCIHRTREISAASQEFLKSLVAAIDRLQVG